MRFLAALILALALALPAAAQQAPRRTFSNACLQQCEATSRDLAANAPGVQACLIRCQAGSDYTRGVNQAPRQAVSRSTPAPTPAGSWGVIYAATPPNSAIGTSQGVRDRNQAHMQASQACSQRAGGANCRILAEAAPGECIAAVQAGQIAGLVRTSDPRTFQVSMVDYGKGDDTAAAERSALASCSGRGRCEIAATVCGQR